MLTAPRVARWLLAALVAGAVAAPGRVCRAGDVSDAEKAEQLIREGNALRRKHQDARALPLFQQAYDISRTPRSAAQLGLAELALGYWDAANDHLTEGLTVGRNPWVEQNRRVLEAALKEAKSHLAGVTVEGRPAGAEVLFNGKSVGTLPLAAPVPVNEGRVEIDVRAAGYESDHRVLTVAGNSPAQVSVNLKPAAAPKLPPPTVDRPPVATSSATAAVEARAQPAGNPADLTARPGELPGWRRALPWALAVGAVAAGGIAVWQATSAAHALDQFNAVPNNACGASDPNHGTDPSCNQLYQDWSSRRTNAWIGAAAAGALGVGAAALFVWNAYAAPVDVQVGMGTARITFRHTF
jgi:hypothetical protein